MQWGLLMVLIELTIGMAWLLYRHMFSWFLVPFACFSLVCPFWFLQVVFRRHEFIHITPISEDIFINLAVNLVFGTIVALVTGFLGAFVVRMIMERFRLSEA